MKNLVGYLEERQAEEEKKKLGGSLLPREVEEPHSVWQSRACPAFIGSPWLTPVSHTPGKVMSQMSSVVSLQGMRGTEMGQEAFT